MDYLRIKPVTEQDFDSVVVSAGGSRILEEDSADYRLNEAVIELKLIIEEGFEKESRQRKLASLFRITQPDQPVVLISHKKLNPAQKHDYYRIVEVPIKTACKKASKQLQKTASRCDQSPVRVLVILNVGYTLLSPDEFKDVCCKCVRNDTSGVDWLVCGGIYFYSDKFENYVIAHFEDFPINLSRSFPSNDVLGKSWGVFLNSLVSDMMRNPKRLSEGRLPVIDLTFDLEGIRYVKPAPTTTQSEFWPGGVPPRENTSGINECPIVARTFPSLLNDEWKYFKEAMPSVVRLKNTYRSWLESYPDENLSPPQPLKPFVVVEVKFEEFINWIKKPKAKWEFSDIANFSNQVFHNHVSSVLEGAKEKSKALIIPLSYIHLVINEVGNDKVNDFSSIYYVSEVPGFERTDPLVKNARLFYEYGMALAAAYAIKHKVNSLLFTKRRAY